MGEQGESSLRERLAVDIRQAILGGEFPPDSVLPETTLAKRYGVSRGPIRDALGVLEREGLIVSPPNRRARVVNLSLRDVEEIYSLRRVLETLAAHRAPHNITEPELDELEGILGQMRAALDAAEYVRISRLDADFHDRICAAARHRRLYLAWSEIRSQVTLFLVSRNTMTATSFDIVVGEHRALLDALRARDEELLVRLTDSHLSLAYERLRDHMILEGKA